MTAGAIIAGGLLVFPVTGETRVVRVGHRLVKPVRFAGRVRRRRQRRDVQFVIRLMTDCAVVVIKLLVVGDREQGSHQACGLVCSALL